MTHLKIDLTDFWQSPFLAMIAVALRLLGTRSTRGAPNKVKGCRTASTHIEIKKIK